MVREERVSMHVNKAKKETVIGEMAYDGTKSRCAKSIQQSKAAFTLTSALFT